MCRRARDSWCPGRAVADPAATSLGGLREGRARSGWSQAAPHPAPPAGLFSPLSLPGGQRGAGVRRRPGSHHERWMAGPGPGAAGTGLGPARGWGRGGARSALPARRPPGTGKGAGAKMFLIPASSCLAPAPPLPPNKPFPIAQLTDGPPARPSPGLPDPDPPPRGSQTPGPPSPQRPPAPGSRPVPPPRASHIRRPEGAGLGLGRRGSLGVGSRALEARARWEAGTIGCPGRGGVRVGWGGAPPAARSR